MKTVFAYATSRIAYLVDVNLAVSSFKAEYSSSIYKTILGTSACSDAYLN
jgi:hypothetical protein